MAQKKNIGWIGTGVMGTAMASHLLNNGFPVHLYNRTKQKAEDLIAQGAVWHNSPKEVCDNSDIIFTIVGFPEDVQQVYFDKNGVFAATIKNKILVDMTTTKPSLAFTINKNAEGQGASFLDAPVSGGDVGAKKGTLSIMVGGEKKTFDQMLPLFKILGQNIVYQGVAGSGQHTKMSNQIVIAGTMIGVCESLLYAVKSGLDQQSMLQSIRGGAAACWTLDNLAPRIIKGDFEPGFFVHHFVKDMRIALEEAEKMGLTLPGLEMVKELYENTISLGYAEKGTHALYLALKKLSGIN